MGVRAVGLVKRAPVLPREGRLEYDHRMLNFLELLDELQTIARNGLAFTESPYDRERYERLLEIAVGCYGRALDLPPAEVRKRLSGELGYVTPKVGSDAAIFDDEGRVLLVRRSDNGLYCLPCGWLGPNESPEEGAVRETKEETGLEVRVLQLVEVFSHRPGPIAGPHSSVSLLYLCEVVGGEIAPNHEAVAVEYRSIDDVPGWHQRHKEYARAAFEARCLRDC